VSRDGAVGVAPVSIENIERSAGKLGAAAVCTENIGRSGRPFGVALLSIDDIGRSGRSLGGCSTPSAGAPKTGAETRAVEFFDLEHLPLLPPPYRHWIADAARRHPMILKKNVEGVNYRTLLKLLIQHPILVGRFLLTKLGIHINR